MPPTMKVLALPRDGWRDDAERDTFKDAVRSGNPRGYTVIFDYTGVDDLVSRIRDAMQQDTDHPCLELLEIWAHGNPIVANGLTYDQAGAWGTRLMTLTWCDQADVYLAGCNTGLALSTPVSAAPGAAGPVARLLADGMPFDAAQFPHRITFHGSAGYLYGPNAFGTPMTECRIQSTWQQVSGFFSFLWGMVTGGPLAAVLQGGTAGADYPPYPGCRQASGAQAWNEFRNWR